MESSPNKKKKKPHSFSATITNPHLAQKKKRDKKEKRAQTLSRENSLKPSRSSSYLYNKHKLTLSLLEEKKKKTQFKRSQGQEEEPKCKKPSNNISSRLLTYKNVFYDKRADVDHEPAYYYKNIQLNKILQKNFEHFAHN